jgi:hypothetical protein
MVGNRGQLAIVGLEDPADIERDGDDQALLFEALVGACRAVARELGYDACAAALDAIWGERGRPVSAAVMRAALNGTERNYFRVEWAIWFARRSEHVADILLEIAGRGSRPRKTAEQELEDLKALLRDELSHKRAEQLIRKAGTI